MSTSHRAALPHLSLLIVCDGGKALIMRNAGTMERPKLQMVETLQHEVPPTRELGSERPGRVYASTGAARSAVETAVRELGYRPNLAARSLVTRRTDSIAVVVPEPDERVFADPFFARTLSAVNRVLAERDLQLVLLLARPGEDDDRDEADA